MFSSPLSTLRSPSPAAMRLLFTRFPYESAHGGLERQTLDLAAYWARQGHEVHFWGSDPILLAAWKKIGPTHPGQLGEAVVTPGNAVKLWFKKRTLVKNAGEELSKLGNFDAVIMLSINEKILLTERLAKHNKVIWLEHERVGRWLRANPWLRTYLHQSQFADLVTVSPRLAEQFVNLGIRHIHAIPNGVSLPPPVSRQFSPDRLTIGTVGRLTHEKGIDLAIKAIFRLIMDFPHLRLEIVGDGREKNNLIELVDRLNLKEHIRFLGELTTDQIRQRYPHWDLFLASSRDFDTFGLAAAEALAYGLPTILSRQYGLSDLLTDKVNAILVDPTETEIEQGIRRALPYLAPLAQQGQKYAADHLSLEQMFAAYDEVL